MDNYLEHEVKVKYIDGILAHSQDWQWLIDTIQKTFEIKMISSWRDYINNSTITREVFSYFVKILEVCDKQWDFSKNEFAELWQIAQYYVGGISIAECINDVKNKHCKTLLFCVWITKLTSSENSPDVLYDIRVLTQINYFQLAEMDLLAAFYEELFEYGNNINILGIDQPLRCFHDNIKQVEHSYSETFFDDYSENLHNYNAFSFQHLQPKAFCTWQESYLLDMLKVSIKERTLRPAWVASNWASPEISLWTQEVLSQIKSFFNHEDVDFICDTILYLQYNIPLPAPTTLMHLQLLLQAFNDEKNLHDILQSSSYKVITYLFQDRLLKEYSKDDTYRAIISKIQNIKEIQYIQQLENDGCPIHQKQKEALHLFYQTQYQNITEVNTLYLLVEYMKNINVAGIITKDYLQLVSQKFNHYINSDEVFPIAMAFYQYMVFLLQIRERNSIIDKRWVYSEMIRIQKLWQDDYYKSQCTAMQHFAFEQQIPQEMIERNSRLVFNTPVIFAGQCINCTEDKILQTMESASNNPFSHCCQHINISSIFPVVGSSVILDRHDIDQLHVQQIKKIIAQKGYKLLNVFDPDTYLYALHQNISRATLMMVSLFIYEQDLYEQIQLNIGDKLMPYAPNVKLGMVTQLFPILEIKIRELATLFGVFPFKKNTKEFMQNNDPSSLLREILMMIYEEQESFENVPDFLFVYHIMYNSNSFNVRNECIHGRDYLENNRLEFAFKATLLAIHMICFRIETITANQSDILQLE